MYRAQSLDITAIFVGMFDEVDEGTAIFKVTNDPPIGNYFATYLGRPSDRYLRLVGTASQMFRGETPWSATIPSQPLLPQYDSDAINWTLY